MSSFDLEDMLINLMLAIVKAFILVHDIITYPIYSLVYRPWSKLASADDVAAAKENTSDRLSPWISKVTLNGTSVTRDASTLCQLFSQLTRKYGDKMCLGYRDVFMKDEEVIYGVSVIKKIPSPDFKWLTYVQVDKRIDDVVKGLIKYHISPDDKVILFMENRIEYTLVLHALLRLGCTVVIINEQTSEQELQFIATHVESAKIFTSSLLLDKVDRLTSKLTSLDKCVFYAEDATESKRNTSAIAFSLLVESGAAAPPPSGQQLVTRKATDLAIIYYVSSEMKEPLDAADSTSTDQGDRVSRGVMITHENLMTAVWSLDSLVSEHLKKEDLTDSQFPAHMTSLSDLITCHVMLANGIPVAFSTLGTLTDSSDSLKSGSRGDLSCIRAKIINSVPSLLDTFNRQFNNEYEPKNERKLKRKFFEFALTYKHYWQMKGFDTPLLNLLVFNRLKGKVGRNIQLIINRTESEMLAPSSEAFIRSTMNCSILNGLACAETCGFFSLKSPSDSITLGSVGTAMPGYKIKLADWPEGGFTTYDLPHSRGELLVSGAAVSTGYFKDTEKSGDTSFVEENGTRWFKSGFIAEMRPNGHLYVYGRKESMVRLELGQTWLSLALTAATLRSNKFIRQIFCYANQENNFIIALINADASTIDTLSASLDIEEGSLSFKEMCSDPEIQAEVTKSIIEQGVKSGISKNALPSKIKLCSEVWTTDNNFLLPDSTPNRGKILEFYKKDISRMFNHGRKFVLPPSVAANNNNNNTSNSNNNHTGVNNNNMITSDITAAPRSNNTSAVVETKTGVEMTRMNSTRKASNSSSSSSEYSETTMSRGEKESKSHL